ncbi:MAG: tetratricopeptide repeat protein [Pseudomonadota bacterium]
MRNSHLASIVAVTLAVAALAIATGPAVAQTPSPEAAPQERPQREPKQRSDVAPSIEADEQAGLPATPADRSRILEGLYAHLATADGEESAQLIAQSIERIWLHSGSETVSLLMGRAIRAAEEKRLDLAIQLLDAVVELAPDFAEGWNRRALVHYMRDDYALALGDLRRVLALEPNHFKALDGLVQILREMGEKKAALKALQQLLAIHPHWQGGKQALEELAREVEGQGI